VSVAGDGGPADPESAARPAAASLVEVAAAGLLCGLATAMCVSLAVAATGFVRDAGDPVGFAALAEMGAKAAGVIAALLAGGWVARARGVRPSASDAAIALAAIVLVARAWPGAVAWPAFLDGGWYAAAATAIARHGALVFEPPVLVEAHGARDIGVFDGTAARGATRSSEDGASRALVATLADHRRAGMDFPLDDGRGFFNVAFSVPSTGSPQVAPYHPPWFAAWVALWLDAEGSRAAPAAAGRANLPWAVAWLLALGVVARSAGGPTVAVAACWIAALTPAARWYAGQPYAEMAAGALALAGLALASIAAAARIGVGGEEHAVCAAGPIDSRTGRKRRAGPRMAALGMGSGLALGLAAAMKLDMLPVAAIAGVWWAVRAVRARSAADLAWFCAGLAVPVAAAIGLALGPAAVYYRLNLWGVLSLLRHGLRSALPLLTAALLIGALVVIAALAAARRSRTTERSSRRAAWPWPAARAPEAGSFHGRGSPWEVARKRACAWFGTIAAGLLVAAWGHHLSLADPSQPPNMFALLAWNLTPVGTLAMLAGVAVAPCTAMFRPGGAPSGWPQSRQGAMCALAIALASSAVVLVAPVVTRDLSPLYVARRLVPVALPTAAILAGCAVAWAWHRGRGEPKWRASAIVLLGIAGAGMLARSAPLEPARDLAGARIIVERLARYGDERDVLLFPSALGAGSAGRLAAAVFALEGRQAVVLGPRSVRDETVVRLVEAWRAADRRVFQIADNGQPNTPIAGLARERVGEETVVTEVLAPVGSLPPHFENIAFEVEVFELVPDG